jgi:hypothetical protein
MGVSCWKADFGFGARAAPKSGLFIADFPFAFGLV